MLVTGYDRAGAFADYSRYKCPQHCIFKLFLQIYLEKIAAGLEYSLLGTPQLCCFYIA